MKFAASNFYFICLNKFTIIFIKKSTNACHECDLQLIFIFFCGISPEFPKNTRHLSIYLNAGIKKGQNFFWVYIIILGDIRFR